MTDLGILEERLKGIERDRSIQWIDQKRMNEKFWISIEKLQNRPPVWVTWVISVQTLIIGLLAGFALH